MLKSVRSVRTSQLQDLITSLLFQGSAPSLMPGCVMVASRQTCLSQYE